MSLLEGIITSLSPQDLQSVQNYHYQGYKPLQIYNALFKDSRKDIDLKLIQTEVAKMKRRKHPALPSIQPITTQYNYPPTKVCKIILSFDC